MKVLFVHQNFPGQFVHLAPALAARGAEVVALTDKANLARARHLGQGVKVFAYASPKAASPATHAYLQGTEAQVRRGQAAARAALQLRRAGFSPDIVVGHPAWGECLFLKDVFPAARQLVYAEFFYRDEGSDFGFDPEFPVDFDQRCRLRLRNATQLASFESADAGISPTHWQHRQYPATLRDKITVVHDGIDTRKVRRRPDARFVLPTGRPLTAADEVVTYVARNLEPYRGFHQFMRALPRVLAARPGAVAVIVGGDLVSYGRPLPEGQTYRDRMLAEVGGALDAERVFFTGRIPYERYLDLLSISAAHVYLTYPFVLSWSLLEAMACECAIVASRTAPVQEVIEHGGNGFLADFFSVAEIAEGVVGVLQNRADMAAVGRTARQTVIERYALERCLATQLRLVAKLLGERPNRQEPSLGATSFEILAA